MSRSMTVVVLVEGQTENGFVKDVLAPYWGQRGIFVQAPIYRTHVDMRSGRVHKGGDIRFTRFAKQLVALLRQRPDTIVASFVDFYGIREWPGLEQVANAQTTSADIATTLCDAARMTLETLCPGVHVGRRYVPFVAVHEFEALLFSDASVLSSMLHVSQSAIEEVLAECGGPEAIDNGPQTAPSKRLEAWTGGSYRKTVKGVSIAAAIGIDTMRRACPNFDAWLTSIERCQLERE